MAPLVLGLLLCTACSGSSTGLGTDTPDIDESATELIGAEPDSDESTSTAVASDAADDEATSQEPTTAPALSPTTPPEPTTLPEPTPPEPTAEPTVAGEPAELTTLQPPADSPFPTVEATTANAIVTGEFADIGCEQGSLLHGVINDTEINDVVSAIPFRVWLCSNTDAVTSQLFCYVEQTKAIVAALPRVTDQDRLDFVSRLAEEDVVFCDNPYFTGLRDGSEYVP